MPPPPELRIQLSFLEDRLASRFLGKQIEKTPTYHLASVRAVTGNVVVNWEQQWIGRIEDVLLDLSGRSSGYAIIASDELFKHEERFAVALSLLSQGAERTFVIDATRKIV